jgi:hypothetical protein
MNDSSDTKFLNTIKEDLFSCVVGDLNFPTFSMGFYGQDQGMPTCQVWNEYGIM